MSSPMDFSKFIDPNASTGTGAEGDRPAGDQASAWGGGTWSSQAQETEGSSAWLSSTSGAADPLGGLQTADVDAGSLTPATPPTQWLYCSIGSAVLGAVLSWVFASGALTLLGWLFAGPVAIGLLGFYHKTDTFRRASGLYSEPSYLKTLYVGAIVVCLVAVIVTAVFVGLWWGRA